VILIRYCIYEGNDEFVIEFWCGGESTKWAHQAHGGIESITVPEGLKYWQDITM